MEQERLTSDSQRLPKAPQQNIGDAPFSVGPLCIYCRLLSPEEIALIWNDGQGVSPEELPEALKSTLLSSG